ncbi:MAG: hypothetical protein IJ221_08395 [Oscillibacter sp.]|nr:hypothetical protein [Oscillibacter sp.]MBR1689314.1 hypothetical protein [Oscillibacter sp.]
MQKKPFAQEEARGTMSSDETQTFSENQERKRRLPADGMVLLWPDAGQKSTPFLKNEKNTGKAPKISGRSLSVFTK